MTERRVPSKLQYSLAWETECMSRYPVIDAFEERMGFAVNRERLEAAARVLACPIKKNPPNWQHGRVLYALGRSYLAGGGNAKWLDLGTAKSFSACVMSWAMGDAGCNGIIHSVDIIDPVSREPRNSVEDGKTVEEFAKPFRAVGIPILFEVAGHHQGDRDRIGFAFIDGSHTYDGVKSDIRTVTPRQQTGDIIMFDDLQVPAVARAVSELKGYEIEIIRLMPTRKYAIAVKQ